MTETLKPCPLAEALELTQVHFSSEENAEALRAELAKRGYAITRAPDDVAQIVAWQPIETWPGTDEAYAFVCRAGNVVPFVACYDANGDEWTSWNGHYERGGKQLIPTHWMPLLVPPAERGDWKDKDDG